MNTRVVSLTLAFLFLVVFPLAAATFTVTNNPDSGPGSFRDAITQANALPGPDVIDFNIANGGLGIDLQNNGVTLNDAGDFDSGPNEELNFPVITFVVYSPGATTITGTLSINGSPATAAVELFRSRVDPSGYGEGEVYLGPVTPDGAGNWSFTATTLVPGDAVTATATDSMNNTSEFCLNASVPGAGPVLAANVQSISQSLGGIINFTLTAGAAEAGRNTLLVAGVTGTTPGTFLPGGLATIPINRDWFTNYILANHPKKRFFLPVEKVSPSESPQQRFSIKNAARTSSRISLSSSSNQSLW